MNTKGSNRLTLIECQKLREMLDENENCKSTATVLAKDERSAYRLVNRSQTPVQSSNLRRKVK